MKSRLQDEMALDHPATELAIGHDGTIYVNTEGVSLEWLRGRKIFVGSALKPAEVQALRKLPLDSLSGYVLASDGEVYASTDLVSVRRNGREKVFRGYALKRDEARVAVEEIHRMAFNVPIAVAAETKARRTRSVPPGRG